jgi:hypothetical protein
MSDYIFYLFLILVVLFSFVNAFWSIGGSRKSIDSSQKSIDHFHEVIVQSQAAMTKRAASSAEALAVTKRLVEQGDETIALLKVIKEGLEHRTIKN